MISTMLGWLLYQVAFASTGTSGVGLWAINNLSAAESGVNTI